LELEGYYSLIIPWKERNRKSSQLVRGLLENSMGGLIKGQNVPFKVNWLNSLKVIPGGFKTKEV